MQSDDIEASLVWFYKLYDQFYQAAHYRLLLESTQQFTRIVKTRLGEEHIKY